MSLSPFLENKLVTTEQWRSKGVQRAQTRAANVLDTPLHVNIVSLPSLLFKKKLINVSPTLNLMMETIKITSFYDSPTLNFKMETTKLYFLIISPSLVFKMKTMKLQHLLIFPSCARRRLLQRSKDNVHPEPSASSSAARRICC